MKKILLLALLLSVPQCVKAYSGDVAPASVLQVHDMQMLYEQKFRQEEVNDYKDLKEEKARFWKKDKAVSDQIQQIETQVQKRQEQVAAPSKRSEFIEENGQLKIKYY